MSVKATKPAVGTTASQISPVQGVISAGLSLVIKNTGAVPVYLGGPDVDTTAGFPLAVGESFTADANDDDILWVIAGSATTISVLGTGDLG